MPGTPPAYTARAYIDGRWVPGEGEPFEVINPATEEVLAVVPGLTTAQADEAAAAAVRAFAGGPWSKVPARQRSQLLHRLADLIERDTDRLIDLMIDEIGTPRAVASFMQVPFPVRNLRWFADAAAGLAAGPDQTLPTTAAADGTATLLTREPIGVVLGLTAFNFPLNLAAWKIGGALAARLQHRPDVLAQVRPDHHGARRPWSRRPVSRRARSISPTGRQPSPSTSAPIPVSTSSPSPARRRWAGASSR